ncbi:MAG: hypothetical protein Q9159_001365 [Coniocarpon cinnabarinum]
MTVPPEVLRIKRKHIESSGDDVASKRQTLYKDYVFRRQAQENTFVQQASIIPKILATRPGDEKISKDSKTVSTKQSEQDTEAVVKNDVKGVTEKARRQFHLSRPSVAKASRKRKERGEQESDVAVLVEGRARKLKTAPDRSAVQPSDNAGVGGDAILKRPGAASRLPKKDERKVSNQQNGAIDPRIEAAMLRYAAENEDTNVISVAPTNGMAKELDDSFNDATMQEAEDGDYVYDTFLRFSADSSAPDTSVVQSDLDRVGYLILEDGDQELLEIYADADYESEDWDSEQDDENGKNSAFVVPKGCSPLIVLAENYYGADYPEDELDFEDEFDDDAYRYRKGAASDDEEFDKDDAWSDDEFSENSKARHGVSDSLRTPADVSYDDTAFYAK